MLRRRIRLAALLLVAPLFAIAAPRAFAQHFETRAAFNAGAPPRNEVTPVLDAAGRLYVATLGATGCGQVVRIAHATGSGTATESVLHSFACAAPDGALPLGNLAIDPRGNLFGLTAGDQTNGVLPTAFRISPPATDGDSWTFATLYTAVRTGAFGFSSLQLEHGGLVGTDDLGRFGALGRVFRLRPTKGSQDVWNLTTLHYFGFSGDGQGPVGPLWPDGSGGFTGLTGFNGVLYDLAKPATQGTPWQLTVLAPLPKTLDGLIAAPARDANGVIYFASKFNGANRWGAIYRLMPPAAPGGAYTTDDIYDFTGGQDGGFPGPVSLDATGNLVGVTSQAKFNDAGWDGAGEHFYRLSPPVGGGLPWVVTQNLTFPRCSHHASAGCFPVVAAPAVDRITGEVVVTTSAGGANGNGAVLVVR